MSDTKALEDGGGVDSAEDVATDPNINPTALPLPPVPVLALVIVLVLPPVVTIRDGAVNVKPLIGATKADRDRGGWRRVEDRKDGRDTDRKRKSEENR